MLTMKEAVSKDPGDIGRHTLFWLRTRVPVRNLFDYLEGGNGIDYFLESFSWVSRSGHGCLGAFGRPPRA